MRAFNKIPTLSTTQDLIEKAEHDLNRFREDRSVYSMADCFLTLNAIPEWLEKHDGIDLGELNKNNGIIKGEKCNPTEEGFKLSVEEKLRFVRCFCNHIKHAKEKKPIARVEMASSPLPVPLPITFDNIAVTYTNGKTDTLPAENILEAVLSFWKEKITNAHS